MPVYINYELGFYCNPAAGGKAGDYVLETVGHPANCWWRVTATASHLPESGFSVLSAITIQYAEQGTAGFNPGPVNYPIGVYHKRPDNTYGSPAPGCAAALIIDAAKTIDVTEVLYAANPPANVATHPAGSPTLKKNYVKARHKG